jgi:hypothetical protein
MIPPPVAKPFPLGVHKPIRIVGDKIVAAKGQCGMWLASRTAKRTARALWIREDAVRDRSSIVFSMFRTGLLASPFSSSPRHTYCASGDAWRGFAKVVARVVATTWAPAPSGARNVALSQRRLTREISHRRPLPGRLELHIGVLLNERFDVLSNAGHALADLNSTDAFFPGLADHRQRLLRVAL